MPQPQTSQPLFDKRFSDLRKARALRQSPQPHFLNNWAIQEIIERLSLIRRSFSATIIDAHNPALEMFSKDKTGKIRPLPHMGDEGILPLDVESCDLFISLHEIQRMNDPLTYLYQVRHALRPDGFFICAFPGDHVLPELKDAMMQAELHLRGGLSPRLLPTIAKPDMGALMQQAGFALPVVDSEKLTLSYRDLNTLYADIRALGGGNILNARDKSFTGKSFFQEIERLYRQNHTHEDGTYKATLDIIFAAGWAPHASQQKPSPRGSGTVSLTDVL